MGYKHRTKSGKIKHYQSKAHYQRSLEGFFANQDQPRKTSKIRTQNIEKPRKKTKTASRNQKISGKTNISAPLQQRAQHKPHENKFLMDINWRKTKAETLYVNVDGEIRMFGGKQAYSVDGLYIANALTANNIQSIHNHPSPHPPSDRDIFDLLYSGNRTREVVMSSDGKMYILLRTPKTKILTQLDKKKLRESKKKGFSTEELLSMNKDEKEARKKFTKMYHDVAMKVAKDRLITSQKELEQKEVEIQKAMLDAMSIEYKFDYVKMKHSPSGKMKHNFLITRMLFSKSDAKKILHHVRFGYKGERIRIK